MKAIVLSPVSGHSHRKSYAVKRMNLAAQRLLQAETPADEIRAGQWVLAWAVAAGARPSARALRSAEDCVSSLAELRLH
ncbi:hypothetical protein [Duganella aceris]|jgi:hypothetical protein|uniref:Uncharacterized protein n=1 Tax=Duganella aceris TaxID=2703883 RepID=A0ABX0FT11_9BURK|nr:hypothetical protein [Duganella aceris]NGZ87665.1 hypothetical protein [Duganella aceris]